MRMLTSLCVAFALLTPSLHGQSDALKPSRVTKRSADRITLEELQGAPEARDAYELVRQLRPGFLVERSMGSAGRARVGRLVVWVNGAERGPLETLRTIPAHAVIEIRKISATDAVTQYGKDQNGVILVTVVTSGLIEKTDTTTGGGT